MWHLENIVIHFYKAWAFRHSASGEIIDRLYMSLRIVEQVNTPPGGYPEFSGFLIFRPRTWLGGTWHGIENLPFFRLWAAPRRIKKKCLRENFFFDKSFRTDQMELPYNCNTCIRGVNHLWTASFSSYYSSTKRSTLRKGLKFSHKIGKKGLCSFNDRCA